MAANPGTYNIEARQGTPFVRSITYTDANEVAVDLTGYTAYMPVRRRFKSGALLFQLTHTAGITLGGAAGTIELYASATLLGDQPAGVHQYDLVLVPAGDMAQKFTLLTGNFEIEARVEAEIAP